MIGSLVYLTFIRPDIVQVACYCTHYKARPTGKHLKEVKGIFRHLKNTINMGLWYAKDSGFELTDFSDVDHAGCLDTCKSTSEGIQFLGDKLVSWMSKKQDCVIMSMAESEYAALSASCAQFIWIGTRLKDYGFDYNKIPMYYDSQSAIAISYNPVQHSRTKHINVHCQFIKEQEQEIKNVEEQPAERRNRAEKSLQNFRVIHKSSISLKDTSQISSVHAVAPILSTKEPENSLSMGYEHLSINPETESDKVTESNAKSLLPIPSECDVTLEDKRECDELICKNSSTIDVCDNHSEILFDSNNDDLSSDNESFKDIEYEHEATTDTELPSTEDIQPLPVQEPPQNFDIHQIIEECSAEISEKQKMEDTMLDALDFKLLLINLNSQRLDKKEQEVKNVVEQPFERGNRSIQYLQNFRVVHKSSISFKNTSQISSIRAVAHVLSTKEPEHLLSMGYEHLSIIPETESDEVTMSNAENLLPIPSKFKVTLEDKKECDLPISKNSPVCDNHSDIFIKSKIDDDISVYDDFEDVEYVEALLPDPEIVSVEEENVVQQEEEEVDFEDISQFQDIVLYEKLLSITHLICNIESLNDNSTPNRVLNSFNSDNSLLDKFLPEFETFYDHSEETRSGNTTHADNSFPEYDSFCFEIETDKERLINLVKNNIPDDSSNDSLLEEVDLFLSNNLIPPGIENFADDPEGDIRFLEELLINDSNLSHELFDFNFEDKPSIPRPPPEPPDVETDAGEEIPVMMNDKDEDVDYSYSMFVIFDKMFSLLSAKSEDTIFDPGISD
nr:uncharacterized mitochondrial protein AtMg00810-like [Tanacetum cinerariifolium]